MAHQKTLLRSLPEFVVLGFFFALFRVLPLDVASALGSLIGRNLGPKLKWHRIAATNLRAVFPQKNEAEIAKILHGMWDNLGRTLAEYPWLNSPQLAARIQMPLVMPHPHSIYAAAHLGNWEVTPLVSHLRHLPLTLIYRRINNPLVDKLIYHIRHKHCAALYPKGRRGAAEVLRALKSGRALGILIDQKMNDGIEVPFFGLPAMSAPATADLAKRFHVPIVMTRVVREPNVRFRIEFCDLPFTSEEPTPEIMCRMHQQLEQWILEHPDQWLWIHRRWGGIT
jgi:KDO2-lipid IV(A) lauroyltransferase